MAKKYDNIKQETLIDLPLGNVNYIKVSRKTNTDTNEVSYDIRKWYYKDDADGNKAEQATTYGLNINPKMMKQIIEAISLDMAKDGFTLDMGE